LPDYDPDKISDSAQLMSFIGKGLRTKDIGVLSNEIASIKGPEGKEFSDLKRKVLEKARATLTRSNPMYGVTDEVGDENLQTFNQYFVSKLSNAKSPEQTRALLDPKSDTYIGKEIGNYVKSPSELMNQEIKRKRSNSLPAMPENLKRLPNESIKEWQKRTGKGG
jgi:hypothetical protein